MGSNTLTIKDEANEILLQEEPMKLYFLYSEVRLALGEEAPLGDRFIAFQKRVNQEYGIELNLETIYELWKAIAAHVDDLKKNYSININ